jgi:hypothetical protein
MGIHPPHGICLMEVPWLFPQMPWNTSILPSETSKTPMPADVSVNGLTGKKVHEAIPPVEKISFVISEFPTKPSVIKNGWLEPVDISISRTQKKNKKNAQTLDN